VRLGGADALVREKPGVTLDRTEVSTFVNELEAELNQGGFPQYWYNSAGDHAAEAIQALRTIGAFRMADIVGRAVARFPGGISPKERFARQDVLPGHFPDRKAFCDLDDEVFQCPDNLADLLKRYDAR
jgi:hypothetical protein